MTTATTQTNVPAPVAAPKAPDPAASQPGPFTPPAAWWAFSHGLETWTEWLTAHPEHAVPLDPDMPAPTARHPTEPAK